MCAPLQRVALLVVVHRSPISGGVQLAESAACHMRRRPSKITNPITPTGPVPFVSRQNELSALKKYLSVLPLVSLHGAIASSMTPLVCELVHAYGMTGASVTTTSLIQCQ